VPSLAEVQRDPVLLEALSVAAIVALRRQLSHLAADLDAAFCQAIAQIARHGRPAESPSDRLLTPEAAAARFGVTKRGSSTMRTTSPEFGGFPARSCGSANDVWSGSSNRGRFD